MQSIEQDVITLDERHPVVDQQLVDLRSGRCHSRQWPSQSTSGASGVREFRKSLPQACAVVSPLVIDCAFGWLDSHRQVAQSAGALVVCR